MGCGVWHVQIQMRQYVVYEARAFESWNCFVFVFFLQVLMLNGIPSLFFLTLFCYLL